MKLSVFILTWNCLDTLKDTFENIYYETLGNDGELVIVDNGSNDGTKEFIESRYAHGFMMKYIRFDENQGISKGKNAGIVACEGDYIFMLDADVDPVPNSISMFVEYLDQHPECDAIGAYPNDWTNQKNNKFGQMFHETGCARLVDPKLINRSCIYYGVFRRKMFDDGLKFNTDGEFGKPGYGWEDFDFFNRFIEMGYEQWVAKINHKEGKYYHHINSSIRAMGRQKYITTSQERNVEFKKLWKSQSINILES